MRKLAMMLGAVLVSVFCMAQEARLDFDPVLQGVWHLHATSKDGGNTIVPADGGVFCRVFATKVRFADGRELYVEDVAIVEDQQGNPGNIVRFTNGTVWGLTKQPNQAFVLVQVYTPQSNGQVLETFRAVITVSQ